MAYYRETAAEAFEKIAQGTAEPYRVLGDFLDDFYSADISERMSMLATPLPTTVTHPKTWRWLVYFVAAIDWLCFRFALEVPEWVRNPIYDLDEPWFLFEGWRLRAWQLTTTPVPFKMRNIFTGDTVLSRV